MAAMASASTTGGTGVSHTPWARLTPPMRSHSVVIARISDWTVPGASSLSCRRERWAVTMVAADGAVISGTGNDPFPTILQSAVLKRGGGRAPECELDQPTVSARRRRIRLLKMGVSLHELSIVSSVVNSVIGSLEAYAGARVIEARL